MPSGRLLANGRAFTRVGRTGRLDHMKRHCASPHGDAPSSRVLPLPKSVRNERSLPFIDRAVRDRDFAIQTAPGKFADDCVSTLQRHLTSTGAGRLGEAYGFGEAARHAGISIPELAALHHDALLDFLLQPGTQDAARRIRNAKEFLMEALSSFERPSGEATAEPRPLHEVPEKEARRIAHALHDEASQLLACVHMALEDLGAELPDRARERVQIIRNMVVGLPGLGLGSAKTREAGDQSATSLVARRLASLPPHGPSRMPHPLAGLPPPLTVHA